MTGFSPLQDEFIKWCFLIMVGAATILIVGMMLAMLREFWK